MSATVLVFTGRILGLMALQGSCIDVTYPLKHIDIYGKGKSI